MRYFNWYYLIKGFARFQNSSWNKWEKKICARIALFLKTCNKHDQYYIFCLHNDNLGRCDIFIQSETFFIDDEYSQGRRLFLYRWWHGKISALSTNTWVLRVWKQEPLEEYRRHCKAIKNYLRKYGWNYLENCISITRNKTRSS